MVSAIAATYKDCMRNENAWFIAESMKGGGRASLWEQLESRAEKHSRLPCFGVPANSYTCIAEGVEKFNRITAGDASQPTYSVSTHLSWRAGTH